MASGVFDHVGRTGGRIAGAPDAGRDAPIFAAAPALAPRSRDRRLDLVRGLALICIFIDHLPGHFFSRFTLHAFGFIDAAEVFVFVAGIAAGLAYWATFVQKGWLVGLRRVARRVLQVYATHILLVIVCAVTVWLAANATGNMAVLERTAYASFEGDTHHMLRRAALLQLQPMYLNILPLYVVLLATLPLVLLIQRLHPLAVLAVSIAVWMLPQTIGLNLPTDLHSRGWYFNPLAWQLLFVIGVLWGQFWRRGFSMPRSRLLGVLAALYCALALMAVAPWAKVPALAAWRVLPLDWMGSIDKERLSLLRLFDVLALAYLTIMLVPSSAEWLESGPARFFRTLGRHSLTVFAIATLVDMVGWIVWQEGVQSVASQAAAIVIGIGVMGATAAVLARSERARRSPHAAGVAGAAQA